MYSERHYTIPIISITLARACPPMSDNELSGHAPSLPRWSFDYFIYNEIMKSCYITTLHILRWVRHIDYKWVFRRFFRACDYYSAEHHGHYCWFLIYDGRRLPFASINALMLVDVDDIDIEKTVRRRHISSAAAGQRRLIGLAMQAFSFINRFNRDSAAVPISYWLHYDAYASRPPYTSNVEKCYISLRRPAARE